MSIVRFKVWRSGSDIERADFARDTKHFYIRQNGSREHKLSRYYQYFNTEQEALAELERRKRAEAERIALRRVEGMGPELLAVLQQAVNHYDEWAASDLADDLDEGRLPWLAPARELIAKANGEKT